MATRLNGLNAIMLRSKSCPSALETSALSLAGKVLLPEGGPGHWSISLRDCSGIHAASSALGLPSDATTFFSWSRLFLPGNKTWRVHISYRMHPADHTSTGGPYSDRASNTSGARYHL